MNNSYTTVKQFTKWLSKRNITSVFCVADKQSFGISGAEKLIDSLFADKNITIFTDFSPNPKIEEMQAGFELIRKKKPDLVIAVGGGSVMDTAKCLKASISNNNLEEIIKNGKEINKSDIPFAAIPTTAGSGSEATHFAVVYIKGTKFSFANENIKPNIVILEHSLLLKMPGKQIAYSGLDALCQGIESYWSVNSNEESSKYSVQAIKLAFKNLKKAVAGDGKSIKQMLIASHMAGKAINITKTTAPHAFSYYFTSKFNVPHGHAVALTLGQVLKLNAHVSESNCTDSRGVTFVRQRIADICKLLGVKTAEEAAKVFTSLVTSLNLSIKFHELNISLNEIMEYFLKSVNLERLKNNPRELTEELIRTKILN